MNNILIRAYIITILFISSTAFSAVPDSQAAYETAARNLFIMANPKHHIFQEYLTDRAAAAEKILAGNTDLKEQELQFFRPSLETCFSEKLLKGSSWCRIYRYFSLQVHILLETVQPRPCSQEEKEILLLKTSKALAEASIRLHDTLVADQLLDDLLSLHTKQ